MVVYGYKAGSSLKSLKVWLNFIHYLRRLQTQVFGFLKDETIAGLVFAAKASSNESIADSSNTRAGSSYFSTGKCRKLLKKLQRHH